MLRKKKNCKPRDILLSLKQRKIAAKREKNGSLHRAMSNGKVDGVCTGKGGVCRLFAGRVKNVGPVWVRLCRMFAAGQRPGVEQ